MFCAQGGEWVVSTKRDASCAVSVIGFFLELETVNGRGSLDEDANCECHENVGESFRRGCASQG